MLTSVVDVCIVGGGLTGLAAACAFRKRGASVMVVERRTDWGDPNRGDWFQPRAVELLKQWGVDLAVRQPIEIQSVQVEMGPRVVARRTLRKGRPSFCLPQAQSEAALREAAAALGVEMRRGWQLQSLLYTPDQQRVTGLTMANGSDGAGVTAKLVVGADGRASAVRESLGLKLKPIERKRELIAFEADLAAGGSYQRPDHVSFSVGPQGGGFSSPLSQRRHRILAVTDVGESDKLMRLLPANLAQQMPARTPLPLGSTIDPARERSYDGSGAGHSPNYASHGAVILGDAAHPPPVPCFSAITMALLDVDALDKLVGPALAEGDRAIAKALVRFETQRWPDNEARLIKARKALEWLAPLNGVSHLVLRTPLARLFVGPLLTID